MTRFFKVNCDILFPAILKYPHALQPLEVNLARLDQTNHLRGLRVPKVQVNDSAVNWKLVAYTVGGCWIIFAFMFVQGKTLGVFLNPLPILLKGLAGIIVYGYVGGIRVGDVETIFVYWNVIGLLLAWCLHRSKRNPTIVITIITIAGVVHIVLSALALFPAMLFAGR